MRGVDLVVDVRVGGAGDLGPRLDAVRVRLGELVQHRREQLLVLLRPVVPVDDLDVLAQSGRSSRPSRRWSAGW